MNSNISYQDFLRDELDDLLMTNKSIVIFGTLEMAQIAKTTFEFLGKTVACFCDNNKKKLGMAIDGLPIISPEEAKIKFPDAKIYICSFNNNSIEQVTMQLKHLGFKDIHNSHMIYWVYQLRVIKRPIEAKALANTMNILNEKNTNKNNIVVIDTLDFMITEKCTLRCKNCSYFIPYFKKPRHYNKETLIKSIKELSTLVDAIGCISIFGGEPFLHNDLIEICKAVANLNNVYQITIVTNGTILPKTEMLLELKKYITSISISDYGKLSTNKDMLVDQLNKNSISYTIFGNDVNWYENTKIYCNNRSIEENSEIFSDCYWHNRHMLINGEYHFCQVSGIGKLFNMIPNNNDYVNIIDNKLTYDEKKDKLKKLLTNTNSLIACDYCNMWLKTPVLRAEQTSKILEF